MLLETQVAKAPAETPAGLATVLAGIAKGQEDALAVLYRGVGPKILAFARAHLRDPQQAAEVVDEVMLEVWRRANSFQGRSRALTWILGIARHKVLDTLRRDGNAIVPPPAGEALAALAPSPAEQAERRERRAEVRRAVRRLPRTQREVVRLAFFEDRTYPQIARMLSIPEGTVKTRMFHAKKALRNHLAETRVPKR